MPLVAAAMMPHGFMLLPPVSEDAEGVLATRHAMEEVGRRFASAGVDVVVLAGPHGTRVDGAMCVMDVGRAAGTLRYKGKIAEANIPCDRPLIASIISACEEDGVPIAAAGYAGNRPDQSVAPMDWGALVPLWFLGHDTNVDASGDILSPVPEVDPGPPAVLITPSRSLDRETIVAFGRTLGRVFAADPRRVGFVASCDWAHTHTESGPYGAHPKAAEVDGLVVDAVRANDLHSLISLPDDDVAAAAIDGLWQTLILAGIQEVTPLDVDVLTYEIGGYFGMIVAAYTLARHPVTERTPAGG